MAFPNLNKEVKNPLREEYAEAMRLFDTSTTLYPYHLSKLYLFVKTMDFRNVSYKSYRLGAGEAGRLDLIAYREYGTFAYWWIIGMFNNIKNPYTIKSGMLIAIPDLTEFIQVFRSPTRSALQILGGEENATRFT